MGSQWDPFGLFGSLLSLYLLYFSAESKAGRAFQDYVDPFILSLRPPVPWSKVRLAGHEGLTAKIVEIPIHLN